MRRPFVGIVRDDDVLQRRLQILVRSVRRMPRLAVLVGLDVRFRKSYWYSVWPSRKLRLDVPPA